MLTTACKAPKLGLVVLEASGSLIASPGTDDVVKLLASIVQVVVVISGVTATFA